MKKARKPRVSGKILKSGPLRMHFQHSGAKIRVLEQDRDIIKFWLFYSVTAHEYSILTGVISKEKSAASSREIAGYRLLLKTLRAARLHCSASDGVPLKWIF